MRKDNREKRKEKREKITEKREKIKIYYLLPSPSFTLNLHLGLILRLNGFTVLRKGRFKRI